MKKRQGRIINLNVIYHSIAIAFIIASILLGIFKYGSSALRFIQSIWDFLLSIAYYFTEMFDIHVITPTVIEIPEEMMQDWVVAFEVFLVKLEVYFDLLFNKENFLSYCIDALLLLSDVSQFLTIFLLPIALAISSIKSQYVKPVEHPEGEERKPSKQLQKWLKFEERVLLKVKRTIQDFWRFFKEYYFKWFAIIWAWNFRAATIIIEFLAFYFYFAISFDFISIYTQIVKLFLDLSVMFTSVPLIVWIVVGYIIFHAWRKSVGVSTLRKHEDVNENFLKEHPGALFFIGKQRSFKTSALTSLGLTQEKIFREKAFEGLSKAQKQFPNVNWLAVQDFYRDNFKRHRLYTLANIRRFCDNLERVYFKEELTEKEKIKIVFMRRVYRYNFSNYAFDYDADRYGLYYFDGLKKINVIQCIKAYLQHYFIYTAPTSLLFGNYAVRTDFEIEDYGNFPQYHQDFFDLTGDRENEKYSHILDMDSLRMLKKMDDCNPNKDGFEVGCVLEMEYAKERGNKLTNSGMKATDEIVNARNDGHEADLKMRGHAATIENYTFFRLMIDDQRQDSLMAENRDLCDIVHLKSSSDEKVQIPFFDYEQAIDLILTETYNRLNYLIENRQKDKTLLMYLIDKVYIPFHSFVTRTCNQFTEVRIRTRIWDGMDGMVKKEKDYLYISYLKTYSERFATDALKGYYHERALRSKVGLNDFECFDKLEMDRETMKKFHSLFYSRILKIIETEEALSKNARIKKK